MHIKLGRKTCFPVVVLLFYGISFVVPYVYLFCVEPDEFVCSRLRMLCRALVMYQND
jgi:hypothetical protein